MHKRTVIYRGSLKSCNYSCSYCPFARHRALMAEVEEDRQNFARFCDSIVRRSQAFSIGAVFLAPYGEASIHRWYWEGLSCLADLPGIDRVGMQTNLSFSVEECLHLFDSSGKNSSGETFLTEDFPDRRVPERNVPGENLVERKRDKLCIWATFHPEMTTVKEFTDKCHRLIGNHVRVCVGAVGVPGHISIIKELREKLSPAVYLWINKMDGLRRNYSPEEIEAFVQTDPFFEYELDNPEAAAQMCEDRCFVEADGRLRTCNISRIKDVNWYEGREEEIFGAVCSRKRCSCYLAYGGRADFALKNIFGEYPAYRIPRMFRAVFFDLDGTLIPARRGMDIVCVDSAGTGSADSECSTSDVICTGKEPVSVCRDSGVSAKYRHGSGLTRQVREKLSALKEMCPIFVATSMPAADVKKRLKGDLDLFRGYIFASGAYLCLKDENGDREKIYPVDVSCLSEIIKFGENVKAKCKVSRDKGVAYKITLIKDRYSAWKTAECGRMAEILKGSDCRFFTEQNCLEIVAKDRNKGTGLEEMCGWLAIPPRDVLAVGNDEEDDAMEEVCGTYIKHLSACPHDT